MVKADAAAAFSKTMQEAMRWLDHLFNGPPPPEASPGWRKIGLALLIYEFGDKAGRANYVSNGADRRDMILFLRETANRFEAGEGGAPVSPLGKNDPDPDDKIAAPMPDPEGLPGMHEDTDLHRLAIDRKVMAYAWKGFREMVIPDGASPGQIADQQATFFAGASALFHFFATLDDDTDVAVMEGVDAELNDFALAMLKAGRMQ